MTWNNRDNKYWELETDDFLYTIHDSSNRSDYPSGKFAINRTWSNHCIFAREMEIEAKNDAAGKPLGYIDGYVDHEGKGRCGSGYFSAMGVMHCMEWDTLEEAQKFVENMVNNDKLKIS